MLTPSFHYCISNLSGNTYLYDSNFIPIKKVEPLTGAQTTGSGTNTLTVDWTTMNDDETYYVEIDNSVGKSNSRLDVAPMEFQIQL